MDYFFIAKCLGVDKGVRPGRELVDASKFLNVSPDLVIIKARLLLVSLLIFCAVFLFFNFWLSFVFFIAGFFGYYWITESIKFRARSERFRALSQAGELITVFGASLELNPNLERAVNLASLTCKGRLSYDLGLILKRSVLKGVSLRLLLDEFVTDWGRFSVGFARGLRLIINSSFSGRLRSLSVSKGVDSFFSGLINDLMAFMSRVKTHSLIIFSFGTVIPLIVISMIPLVGIAGSSVNYLLVSLMLVVNLLIVNSYANYVIRNRPVVMNSFSVDLKFNWSLFFYCLIVFLIISSVSLIHYLGGFLGFVFPLPEYYAGLPLIAGFSVSFSLYFWLNSKEFMRSRFRALRVEKSLLNVIYSISSRLFEKRSFEDSLRLVISEGVSNDLINRLSIAYRQVRELRVPFKRAIIKELVRSGSLRACSVFRLIFHALSRGVERSADGVMRVYEHYARLFQAEEEHKVLLEQVLSMMALTAVIFAPLIAGFTVLMQELINSKMSVVSLPFFVNELSSGSVALIVGFYVIILSAVLTRYSVIIKYGYDKVMIHNELSQAIISSCLVYIACLFIGKLFI